MSKQIYPSASAPPLVVDNVRIVQPFEIAAEAENVQALESDQLLLPNHRNRPSIRNVGKEESDQSARKVVESRFDGFEITRTEHSIVVQSASKASVEHHQIVQKIHRSNGDDVHELGASLPLNETITCNPGYTFSSPNPADEKVRAYEAAKDAKPKGYQSMEYTSMYDSQGGYKFEEYKSIYD